MEPIEEEGKQHLTFTCPSRGLIGFRSAFATLTRGSGLMHRAFSCYGPYQGTLDRVRKGALVSMAGAQLACHPEPFMCACHTAYTLHAKHDPIRIVRIGHVLILSSARSALARRHPGCTS